MNVSDDPTTDIVDVADDTPHGAHSTMMSGGRDRPATHDKPTTIVEKGRERSCRECSGRRADVNGDDRDGVRTQEIRRRADERRLSCLALVAHSNANRTIRWNTRENTVT